MNKKEIKELKSLMVHLTDKVARISGSLSLDIVKTYLAIYGHQQQEIEQLKADKMKLIIGKARMNIEIERLQGEEWISVGEANILEHMNYLCRYNDCRPFVAKYKDGQFMDLDQVLSVTHICIIPPRKV